MELPVELVGLVQVASLVQFIGDDHGKFCLPSELATLFQGCRQRAVV